MKPKRDGIAEILASGRAPGIIVRGSGWSYTSPVPVDRRHEPLQRGSKQLERDYEKLHHLKVKANKELRAATRLSRKEDGAIRHTGSMPMHEFLAIKQEIGMDGIRSDIDGVFKKAGRKFED